MTTSQSTWGATNQRLLERRISFLFQSFSANQQNDQFSLGDVTVGNWPTSHRPGFNASAAKRDASLTLLASKDRVLIQMQRKAVKQDRRVNSGFRFSAHGEEFPCHGVLVLVYR